MDHDAKAITALILPPFVSAASRLLPDTQCGNRARRTCAMVSHFARAFASWAKAHGKQLVLLFLDLEKAFDSIVWELVLASDSDISVDDLIEKLVDLGLARDLCEEMRPHLEHGGDFAADVPAGLIKLLRDLHSRCWMQVGSLEQLLVPLRGARQGCRFGGVLFLVFYAHTVLAMERKLGEKGLLASVLASMP